MINAKQVYGTYPHVQMRFHIEQTMAGEPASKKAHALGRLTAKYIYNCNEQGEDRDYIAEHVGEFFLWEDTPEGHDFWATINRHNIPAEFEDRWLKRVVPKKAKAKAVPKPAPKKRVGWWT